MKHAPREVRRTERAVYMVCSESCGAEWAILLTRAGEEKRGYPYTRSCPELLQERRAVRQRVAAVSA